MIYSNSAVYGGNEYGKSGHLYIFAFSGQAASFLHHITDTDSI